MLSESGTSTGPLSAVSSFGGEGGGGSDLFGGAPRHASWVRRVAYTLRASAFALALKMRARQDTSNLMMRILFVVETAQLLAFAPVVARAPTPLARSMGSVGRGALLGFEVWTGAPRDAIAQMIAPLCVVMLAALAGTVGASLARESRQLTFLVGPLRALLVWGQMALLLPAAAALAASAVCDPGGALECGSPGQVAASAALVAVLIVAVLLFLLASLLVFEPNPLGSDAFTRPHGRVTAFTLAAKALAAALFGVVAAHSARAADDLFLGVAYALLGLALLGAAVWFLPFSRQATARAAAMQAGVVCWFALLSLAPRDALSGAGGDMVLVAGALMALLLAAAAVDVRVGMLRALPIEQVRSPLLLELRLRVLSPSVSRELLGADSTTAGSGAGYAAAAERDARQGPADAESGRAGYARLAGADHVGASGGDAMADSDGGDWQHNARTAARFREAEAVLTAAQTRSPREPWINVLRYYNVRYFGHSPSQAVMVRESGVARGVGGAGSSTPSGRQVHPSRLERDHPSSARERRSSSRLEPTRMHSTCSSCCTRPTRSTPTWTVQAPMLLPSWSSKCTCR